MGLQAGDIVHRLNGQSYEAFPAWMQALGKLKAKEEIHLLVTRGEEQLELSGRMGERQLPEPEGTVLSLEEVPFLDGHLRAFVHRPEGEGPFPTVYFLQGYTCGSVEFAVEAHPMGRLIRQLVERGYLVFRIEKPGVGDSEGTPDCMSIDFPTEMEAFRAGYRYLLDLSRVNREQVFLYGHSLGGIVAPLLASEFRPQGVMVYGTGLYSWHDYMIELVRDQFPRDGSDYAEVEELIQRGKPLLHEFFVEKKHPREIGETPEEKALLGQMLLGYDGHETVTNRHYTFWQTINETNLVEAWKNTSASVLSMYGACDIAALDSDAMEKIAEIVNHYHPGNGHFQLIPDTDHGLALVESKAHKLQLQQQGTYWPHLQEHFNWKYADILHQWMQQMLEGVGKS